MKLKFICLFILIPLLTNCGTLRPELNTSGYKKIERNENNNNLNTIYLMEQKMPFLKSWNFFNDYFVDNEFIGRLGPGLVTKFQTKKPKVVLEVKHPNGMLENLKPPSESSYPYGGRGIEVDFKNEKSQYFISYTDYGNHQTGASLLGVYVFHKKLLKDGEPYRFRKATENSWWKIHDDITARSKYFKLNPDLETSRKSQGIK